VTGVAAQLSVDTSGIPRALKDRDQWVVWRQEERSDRLTKVPYSAGSSQPASSTDPVTWVTYEAAVQSYQRGGCTGIGYVFSEKDGFCGIDLDNSRDAETGVLKPWARQIVENLDSYTEVSPSGRGVKIFIRGRKPGDRCRRKYHDGEIEIYDRDRFFTLTGCRLESAPADINERQDALVSLYTQVFGPPAIPPQPGRADAGAMPAAQMPEPVRMTDEAVLRLASSPRRRDGKGEKFDALWNGRWNDHFNSASEADASLVFTLAYYTKDREQLDRLFRQSKLYRGKWDEQHGTRTYGQMTIDKALEIVTRQYRPRRRQSVSGAAASVPKDAVALPGGDSLPEVFLPGGPVPILTAADHLGRLLARADMYFLRGGALVTLAKDDDGQPILEPVRPAALASIFESVAQLKAFARNHGQFMEVPSICSEQEGKVILNASTFRMHFPVIRLLSRCPVLTERQGGLVQVSGYDRHSGILAFGEPSPDMPLEDAASLLSEMLADFQFATLADRARALAAIITPALAFGNLLGGRAPVDLGEADASQSGKGFRNRLTAAIYNQSVRTVTQKRGGVGSLEETFNTVLIRGHSFVALDNVRGTIDSPAVESFLTEDSYLARVPHQAAVEIDPRRVVVQLTSNKADITVDLANRSSCVRILKQPQGYHYRQYPEGDVLDHVRANQPQYLGAVFAVVRAWHTAGRPRTTETRHDFRPWARAMDWILQNIFRAGSLLEGHRETQVRMATPVLNWLRDVALAVRNKGLLGAWLRASDLAEIVSESADAELPGLPEGGDLSDEDVRKKVLQSIGRRMIQCFGNETVRTIDGFLIERKETDDPLNRRTTKAYCFQVMAAPLDASAPMAEAHRRIIGANALQNCAAQSQSTQADPSGGARAQPAPMTAPMSAPIAAPMKTPCAPNAPMDSELCDSTAPAQRSAHSGAGYISIPAPIGALGAIGAPGGAVHFNPDEDEVLICPV
jgi:hypothetical protein